MRVDSSERLTHIPPQGEICFLSDIRRMKVDMTHARRKLRVMGDAATL